MLSYFGARYYSSDLSIWLSVDPMSGKYPSLSPYTYCADNPVRCVDWNGEEVSECLDKWRFNITTGELKWVSNEGGKYHQTVVMTHGEGELEKAYQKVDFDGPISKMFDPSIVGPKADGAINGALDVVNGAETAFAGATLAVGSEGIASPIGYPMFVAGAAQISIGAKTIAYSIDGEDKLYRQHDMMVDICKSVANSVAGATTKFWKHPIKTTLKAARDIITSVSWSALQRWKATHPKYIGIPKGSTIKYLQP